MYEDFCDLTIKQLMELYYTAQELRCGNLIRQIKEEFSRRVREE